jgi:acyl-coenzyme A synthetase/AMP-(fatty) acid ligase
MQKHLSFTSIHALLNERDTATWTAYWQSSRNEGRNFTTCYPAYIAALVKKIKESGTKRLFIIHSDRMLFLAAFLAALQAGVPAVIPPSDASGLLKDLLEPDDGLFTDQQELSQIAPLFISVDENAIDLQRPPTFKALNPSKAHTIFYTSGSTGMPKAISKTLTQLEEEIIMLEKTWGTQNEKHVFLSTVPHHHIYGLLFSLLWPVCAGYPIGLQTFSYWEDVLGEYDQTISIISSPAHLTRFPHLLKKPEGLNIKTIFSSGGPLPFEAAQEVHSLLGIYPMEVYGSTETGGIAYRQQKQRAELWTKFKNVKLFVGEEDRLCVQSPYLPHALAYQTNDRVLLQENHQFHLLGRADLIVKIEGKRISLLEIERRLQGSEFIKEAAVLCLENLRRDELGAVLVLSEYGQRTLEAIGKEKFVRQIRKNLSVYCEAVALPRKWRFVSELPLNQNGKRSHLLLKNQFVGLP